MYIYSCASQEDPWARPGPSLDPSRTIPWPPSESHPGREAATCTPKDSQRKPNGSPKLPKWSPSDAQIKPKSYLKSI